MSISANQVMTWSDFATTCFNSMKSVCCNIDSYSSSVPSLIRSTSSTTVRSINCTRADGSVAQTVSWTASMSNPVTTVSSSTVQSEWNTYLSNAGINTRSNKVIQLVDMCRAFALYKNFMAYHLKPIYSRRTVYNTSSYGTQAVFQGVQYKTGSLTPAFTLTPIEQSSIPEMTNTNFTTALNNNIDSVNLMRRYQNIYHPTNTLT